MSVIQNGLTVSLTQYACGKTTTVTSQPTEATWRTTNGSLFIEDTTIENNHVTVTALVEDMQLVALAHRDSPEEWVPGLCSTSFELADDESIPTDEAGFCSYLDRLDPQWELIDTSDYQLT
jgi:hypothetical protein